MVKKLLSVQFLFACILLAVLFSSLPYKASAGCLGYRQAGCIRDKTELGGPGGVCCPDLACWCPTGFGYDCEGTLLAECDTMSTWIYTYGDPGSPLYTNDYFVCASNPNSSQILSYHYTGLAANNPIDTVWCDSWGLVCDPNHGCISPVNNGTAQTCANLGGVCEDFIRNGCPQYYNNSNTSYDSTCRGAEAGCCLPDTCSYVSGKCVDLLKTSMPSGYTYDSAGASTLDVNCEDLTNDPNIVCVQPYSNFPSCTAGASSCTTCSATAPGTNTCGQYSGSQTCTHTNTQPCNPKTFSNACTTSLQNHCSANYTCPIGSGGPVACETTLTAWVFKDFNHDGSGAGAGNPDFPGITVTLKTSGGTTLATQTTGSNGQTTFSGLTTGNYTITTSIPANFKATTTNPLAVTLTTANGNSTVYPGITPLYKISGRIFSDVNKNQKYDAADSTYAGGTVNVSNGPTTVGNISVAGDGTWTTPSTLLSGTYKVTYTSALVAGYNYTTPSSWTVTVGDPAGSPACNKSSSLDASCGGLNNGSISNLDFGVTNENPWQQSACFDIRDDSGTYLNQIPASPSCGGISGAYNSVTNADCSTGAGIVFTCNATPDFGLGSANANGWQSGGAGTQQECFTGAGLDVVRTSYEYLLTTARQSDITPIDMATVCGAGSLANCSLPTDLAKGVYQANGDVHLNTYTFPVDASKPQSFIFLINGNLYIDGNIIVPAGSVAAFSTSGSIHVDASVGNTITNAADPAVFDPNIEGLYSADADFVVESYTAGTSVCNADGTPLDKKLNVVGSIVTNASKTGGTFLNNRDLCTFDTLCSSLSYGEGLSADDKNLALSYILTLFADGSFLNHKLFNWQELKP